jgi:hypothetical protein
VSADSAAAGRSALTADLVRQIEAYAARLPVERVMVVGNAPLEPSVERSELIDGADLVIRCNSYVIDEPGDEPCLGVKTNVVVCARGARITRWFFKNYSSRLYLVVNNSSRMLAPPRRPGSWPSDLGEWPLPNDVIGLPLKERLSSDLGGNPVPTTGTTAAFVARTCFPEAELLLTGFSYIDAQDQTSWAHHWGQVVPVSRAHMLDREGALLASWVAAGNARSVP